ncbi:hypothetical protein BC829DRAFT_409055 [Chytridium lagenaria]|nr:hypothetical protein BC829DRAFT_409055 [Chytridium lagenaria]
MVFSLRCKALANDRILMKMAVADYVTTDRFALIRVPAVKKVAVEQKLSDVERWEIYKSINASLLQSVPVIDDIAQLVINTVILSSVLKSYADEAIIVKMAFDAYAASDRFALVRVPPVKEFREAEPSALQRSFLKEFLVRWTSSMNTSSAVVDIDHTTAKIDTVVKTPLIEFDSAVDVTSTNESEVSGSPAIPSTTGVDDSAVVSVERKVEISIPRQWKNVIRRRLDITPAPVRGLPNLLPVYGPAPYFAPVMVTAPVPAPLKLVVDDMPGVDSVSPAAAPIAVSTVTVPVAQAPATPNPGTSPSGTGSRRRVSTNPLFRRALADATTSVSSQPRTGYRNSKQPLVRQDLPAASVQSISISANASAATVPAATATPKPASVVLPTLNASRSLTSTLPPAPAVSSNLTNKHAPKKPKSKKSGRASHIILR